MKIDPCYTCDIIQFLLSVGIRLPAPPLDHSSLKKARQERQKELKMMESIKQVLITCFCLWIIYSISYSNRDNRSYNFHQNIATKLLTPQNKTLVKFDQVRFIMLTMYESLISEQSRNTIRARLIIILVGGVISYKTRFGL